MKRNWRWLLEWERRSLSRVNLEAGWTIGNFGQGMPCPYISRQPTDPGAEQFGRGAACCARLLGRNVTLFMTVPVTSGERMLHREVAS